MPSLPLRTSRRTLHRGPADARWAPEAAGATAVVDAAVYRDGIRQPGSTHWEEALADMRDSSSDMVWIGLHEPTAAQLEGIAAAFDLHPLAVEDAVHAHQRPKLERYDDSLFAVVKTVHYDASDESHTAEVVETGEVMVFIGRNFVITVRHGEHGSLRDLRKRLEADTQQLGLGPSVVLHALLDQVVDDYLVVAAALQADIDEAENSVFSGGNRYGNANRLYMLKREVQRCSE